MTPLIATLLLLQARDTTGGGGRPCQVAVDSVGHYSETTNAANEKTLNGGGGVLAHCVGTSTTISADSFAHYGALGRLDLIGRVQIRDTGFALDARLARYYLREGRLEAHNDVVAVNRVTGSVLRGPNLNYWRAVPGVRDTVELYATQRPTVEYRQRQAGDTAANEPYIIVSDRLRMKGDDRVWAGGKVTIDRSDFAARSDSMMMDQTRGVGVLIGGTPSVEGRGGGGGIGEALHAGRYAHRAGTGAAGYPRHQGDGQGTSHRCRLDPDRGHDRFAHRRQAAPADVCLGRLAAPACDLDPVHDSVGFAGH
ncbi:MAG: hypothetical protein ACM358_05955 [Gemmatimonadota bacterium]